MLKYGKFTASGKVVMRDVLEQIWGDVNKQYGTDVQLPSQKGERGRRWH